MIDGIEIPYVGKMDEEVLPLCDATNRMSGIQTFESCDGYSRDAFRIWFVVDRLESLPPLLHHTDTYHGG